LLLLYLFGDCRGRGRMVAGFTTTYINIDDTLLLLYLFGDCRGHGRMVAGFTTTYINGISAHHH